MKNIFISIIVLILIIAIYFLCIYYAQNIASIIYGPLENVRNMDKIGQFGDSAGAINALFSGLAFAGVIITILIQNYDSKKESESSNRIRFENIFFQMLNLQQEIIKELSYTEDENEIIKDEKDKLLAYRKVKEHISGRELFTFFYENKQFITEDENNRKIAVNGLKELFQAEKDKSIYEEIVIPTYFDHYFRHLYRIVKFVDQTPFLPKDDFNTRYNYIGILRSQLSKNELIFLFYNGLSSNGREKFKGLIEKYAILKNIRLDLLANEEDIALYEKKFDKNYNENSNLDFINEYRQGAFMKIEPNKKNIKRMISLCRVIINIKKIINNKIKPER